MAEDIISLLDNLGWTGEREINVVGLSLGGMIAQGARFISSFIYTHLTLPVIFRTCIPYPSSHMLSCTRRNQPRWLDIGQLYSGVLGEPSLFLIL